MTSSELWRCSATVVLVALFGGLNARGAQPVLVELFTSEGCSSCPPADTLLQKLQAQQPVDGALIIAFEEHVDYWNYLGWTDPFSQDVFTERQKSYGDRFGLSDVYTPQMVVNGDKQVQGGDGKAILDALLRAA